MWPYLVERLLAFSIAFGVVGRGGGRGVYSDDLEHACLDTNKEKVDRY